MKNIFKIIEFLIMPLIIIFILLLSGLGFYFAFSSFFSQLYFCFEVICKIVFFLFTMLLIASLFTERKLSRPFCLLIIFLFF